MRLALIVGAALMLAGCVTASQDPAALAASHDQQCQSFGLEKGTDSYASCRMQLHQSSAEDARQKQARRAAAIQNLDFEYKPYSLTANEPAPQQRVQTTCTTRQSFGDSTVTDCR